MKTLIATTTAIAATALFATTAQAGEMKADMTSTSMQQAQSRTTMMVKTIDADGQVSTTQVMANTPRKTAVLGALATQKTDAYVVEDQTGDLYINHLIPVAELPDPTLNVRTQDTYTVEYRGMTFTNRVVAE